ncbi:hypothetical protein Slin15195_G095670 [Septoria linicola]|uniref:Zn(2)-C6 fungal-type domain-containing protein n=1 Tax=Septoria linicola TaxID=215465 RepID=A0A9Q9B299_9PEZI|nr:hypothetical protein Slin14017_G058760 [Septoria linicola]USW56248.1 hypothetical protein Slin15195_G095670 [Septoria linicola]
MSVARDTLKRHMTTHGPAALADWTKQNEHSHRHACVACAKGKQKCNGDGSSDCSNCTSRGRACVYRDSLSAATQQAGAECAGQAGGPGPGPNALTLSPNTSLERDAVATSNVSGPIERTAVAISEQRTITTPPDDTGMLTTQHESSWNEMLLMPQLLFPFSQMPLLGTDDVSTFCFGADVLNGTDSFQTDTGAMENYNPQTPMSGHLAVMADQNMCSSEDEDVLAAEYLPHVMQVPAETHDRIVSFVEQDLPRDEANSLANAFPSLRHLDVYVQLYFEHYHPRVPVLHVPTFRSSPESWHLVLAVACIGCQYSAAQQKPKHLAVFHRLSQHMLRKDVRHFTTDALSCMQSLLLFHHEMWFAGDKPAIVHLQLYRNVLVTLCRQLLSQDGTVLRGDPQPEQSNDPWLQWVRGEAKRRMLYFTWMTECFHTIFFMLPPLLSIHEMQISLPDHEAHWQADYPQWKRLPQPQTQWPLCSVLARIGREEVVSQSLGASARLTLLLSASVQHTAAENLRQAMTLPSISNDAERHTSMAESLEHLQRRALEALLRYGCAQNLNANDTSSITYDYAIMSRVLLILNFTPAQLLYPASQWQTTESGARQARSQLTELFSLNISRARTTMFEASQLFQYFRAVNALSHIDTLSLLICTLYIFAYTELAIPLQMTLYSDGDAPPPAKIIRLDQAISDEDRDDWLGLQSNCRLHLVGIGLLDADRSSARLFKEASRIMANSALTSRLAAALATMLTSQAMGKAPKFQEDQ